MAIEFEGVWAERRIPVKKDKETEYNCATYLQYRSPKFKIHRIPAHARTAINWKFNGYGTQTASEDMVYYERENDEWVPKIEIKRGDPITVLPWGKSGPTVEELAEQRLKNRWNSIKTDVSSFIGALEDEDFIKYSNDLQDLLHLIESRRFP